MEAMSKQVVPVLYEELYQLNFLPVLYGPSTGPNRPALGAPLAKSALRSILLEFFSPELVPPSRLGVW